jgi:hypothetical protein
VSRAQVSFVRAGLWVRQGVIWSVDPGRSACHALDVPDDVDLTEQLAGVRRFLTDGGNRAIGPGDRPARLAGCVRAAALPDRFEEPVFAGACGEVDFRRRMRIATSGPWPPRTRPVQSAADRTLDTALAGVDYQPTERG